MVRRSSDHSRRSAEEEQDDAEREERRDRTFGQRRRGAEEVEVEEPELLARLVPRIPAEHADAERRGQLHVGRRAAREADDGRRRTR